MSKFDTHGGYFAPKDYLRVNEGGSHDENPNGGVQIGVDPEGNPNLLEEGEPVYKDYVYSDNIEADEKFLEENNLPKKYAGKLYSRIADDFVTEAEERPLDPISRNGLEVMLGRLASAQEGQKQAKEQADLEAELASLSQEELDQLEAMLSQGPQAEPMTPEEEAYGTMEPTGQIPIGMMQAVPGMRCGGKIRYDDGGKIPPTGYRGRASGMNNTDYPLIAEYPEMDIALMAAQPGSIAAKLIAPSAYKGMINGLANGESAFEALTPIAKVGKVANAAKSAWTVAEVEAQVAKYTKEAEEAKRIYDTASKTLSTGKDAFGNAVAKDVAKYNVEEAKKALKTAQGEVKRWASRRIPATTPVEKTASTAESAAETAASDVSKVEKAADKVSRKRGGLYGAAFGTGFAGGTMLYNAAADAWNRSHPVETDDEEDPFASDSVSETTEDNTGNKRRDYITGFEYGYGNGGKVNYYFGGGPEGGVLLPDGTVVKPSDHYLYDPQRIFVRPPYNFEGAINPSVITADVSTGQPVVASGSSPVGNTGVLSSTIPFDRNINGNDFEAEDDYAAFLSHMLNVRDKEEAKQWMQYIQDEIAKSGSKYKLGDFDDWYRLATDKKVGPVHQATKSVAQQLAKMRATRANKVLLDDAKGVSRLDVADANAIGPNLGTYGNYVSQLTPSQALAARELSKRAAATGAMGVVNPNSALAASMMLKYPVSQDDTVSNPENGGIASGTNGGNYSVNNESYSPSVLPTWPRYAGAIGSGLLGLYDTFQQPDKYTARRITPYTPEGRIHMQNQVYNPIDQNMIANAQIAQGNATRRALRNSGMGPSTGAAILAADNNLTGNLGTGFIQSWDANNQRRNAVIAANNQAEAQRAQFDANIDYYRKEAMNKAAMYNAQNDLMIQRLNNEAEGQKYQAISNQIANGLQALSGIGQENFAMNQINTNPAFLGYRVGPNGMMFYNPYANKWGSTKK